MAFRIPASPSGIVPEWTYEGKTPSAYTFFEAIALAGLEDRRIRLDSKTQRALLGSPVFGNRSIVVGSSGRVTCTITADFGRDFESADYSSEIIQKAIDERKQLRPGTSGPRFLGA